MRFNRRTILSGAIAAASIWRHTRPRRRAPFRPSRSRSSFRPRRAGRPTRSPASSGNRWAGRSVRPSWSRTSAAPAARSAWRASSKSAPDGYTSRSGTSRTPPRPRSTTILKYDVVNDFDHLGRITDVPMTLVSKTGIGGQERQRAARLDPQQRRQGHLRPCRHRLGLASVHADADEGAWRADERDSPIAAPARP